MTEPTNGDRSGWALEAVKTYTTITRGEELVEFKSVMAPESVEDAALVKELREEVAGDLVCDLMHLLDRWGIEWAEVERQATMHYRDEAEEES